MYLVQLSKNATTPDLTDKHPYGTYVCYDSSVTFSDAGSGSNKTMTANQYYNLNKSILITEGQTYFSNQTGTNKIGVDTETFDNVVGTLRASIIEQKVRYYSGSTYSFTCQIHNLYYTGDTFPYNYLGRKEGNSYTWTISNVSPSSTVCTFADMRQYYVLDNTNYNNYQNNNLDNLLSQGTPYVILAGSYAARKSITFSDLDRTNSSIMAIYKVPYVAFNNNNATFVEGYQLIKPNNWQQDFTFSNKPSVNELYKLTLPISEDVA